MTNVVPVASSTLKKTKRNQSPKKANANITDQAEKKSSKKSEKKPVEKKEKQPSKTLTAMPIRDLGKVEFVPRWVYANIPDRLSPPSDDKFSFLALYLKVRDLAAAEGKPYFDLNVGQLFDLLMKYSEAHPDTVISQRMLHLKPLQVRDLRARLQWCLVETLKVWDDQVKRHQDAEEKKSEK